MQKRVIQEVNCVKKVMLAGAGMLAVAAPTIVGLIHASSLRLQAQTQETVRPLLEFEAGSVRPNRGGETRYSHSAIGIDYSNTALGFLIAEAYQVPLSRISSPDKRTEALLAGVYDVKAVAGRATPKDQLMIMLQALLADRFKLRLHHEAKQRPVYRMVIGKNGPRLTASGAAVEGGLVNVNRDDLGFRGVSMALLSRILTGHLDREVLNMTGLDGLYDFTLRAERDISSSSSDPKTAASGDWSSSSVFASLEKLGLRLDPASGSIDYLLVDHVELPSQN